jgi:hypothetical protein
LLVDAPSTLPVPVLLTEVVRGVDPPVGGADAAGTAETVGVMVGEGLSVVTAPGAGPVGLVFTYPIESGPLITPPPPPPPLGASVVEVFELVLDAVAVVVESVEVGVEVAATILNVVVEEALPALLVAITLKV